MPPRKKKPVVDPDDDSVIHIPKPPDSQQDLFQGGQEAGPGGMPIVSAESGSKAERLAKLNEFAQACTRCALHETRTKVVFGVGNPEARLVFVGEAPGADEDMQGEPFVGRAGKKLNEIIRAMGLEREDIYICNVIKCRPPGNRTPNPIEISTCSPMLNQQLAVIQPEAIVTLGRPATSTLLSTREGINKLRGRFHSYHDIPLMPTFHPAYLLRAYTPENRKKVWDDMQKVMKLLGLKAPGSKKSGGL